MRRVTLAARRAQRFLRRPPPPRWARPARYAGCGLAALGLAAGLGWWASASGLVAEAEAAVSGRMLGWSRDLGLAVREVYVDGRVRTDQAALREAIAVDPEQPILAVDPDAVRARLERLPWVSQARVARLMPDTIYVRVFERRPLALWQQGGRYALIDRTGAVIEGAVTDAASASRYRHLRVLVGEHAPEQATRLFGLLAAEPELWSRVVAATWVGDRRWTLRLDNRINVLLPENDMLGAWRMLAARAREEGLLDRAISVVDLRFLPDRMRLKVDPTAMGGRGA